MIMSIEDIIKKNATEVGGENGADENILVITLSTCMWCKKCKRFLNEQGMKYKFIDVDKIEFSDKAEILKYLKSTFQDRISYPFLICDSGHVIGYDPKKYKQLLMGGGE